MNTKLKRKVGRPQNPKLAEQRRDEILHAAGHVFAERGYRSTDIQLIADALHIGKGTIYRYFPSKEALFLAAVDQGMRSLHLRMEDLTRNAKEPLQRIVLAIKSYLAFFDEHPEFVELIIQERAEFKDRKRPTYFEHIDAYIKPWQALLRQLITAGRVRDIPVQKMTDVGSDLLYGTIFTNYFAGRRQSFELQAQAITDVVFYGILSDKERACTTSLPLEKDA